MELRSDSFPAGGLIPPAFAFARPDPDTHATYSDNRSPHLAWTDLPDRARSLVLLCVDGDVPSVGDDVNVEGRTIPASLPRCDFAHWIMIDIPVTVGGLLEGACSDGVTPGGKAEPAGPVGSRQGVNDFTGWFASDPDMGGTYRGYDGPAPPWNDDLLHRYCFEVHALDIERLPVVGEFELAAVRDAMDGHVLGSARLVGTYTQNPRVSP